jgi:hypothetical protein
VEVNKPVVCEFPYVMCAALRKGKKKERKEERKEKLELFNTR